MYKVQNTQTVEPSGGQVATTRRGYEDGGLGEAAHPASSSGASSRQQGR